MADRAQPMTVLYPMVQIQFVEAMQMRNRPVAPISPNEVHWHLAWPNRGRSTRRVWNIGSITGRIIGNYHDGEDWKIFKATGVGEGKNPMKEEQLRILVNSAILGSNRVREDWRISKTNKKRTYRYLAVGQLNEDMELCEASECQHDCEGKEEGANLIFGLS